MLAVRRVVAALGLFVALAVTVTCPRLGAAGPATAIPRPIIGGELADDGEFPTVVGVVNTEVGGLCTGTLIHPEWVLTAAHCIQPELLGASSQAEVTAATLVIFDSTNLLVSAGLRVRAAQTIPSPGFDVDNLGDDDIGLVRLATPVTDRSVTPINRAAADASPGLSVVMVGFGATSGVPPAPGEVNAGVAYVLRDRISTSCSSLPLSDVDLDDSKLLCFSQRDNKGKCSGDSGGPSFATVDGVIKVVGVTSFGDEQCEYMGADTRVDAETAFLDQHIPDLACVEDGVCGESCGSGELPDDDDCGDGGGCCRTSSGPADGGAALAASALVALVALRRRRVVSGR